VRGAFERKPRKAKVENKNPAEPDFCGILPRSLAETETAKVHSAIFRANPANPTPSMDCQHSTTISGFNIPALSAAWRWAE
jgi:hypothetical protein